MAPYQVALIEDNEDHVFLIRHLLEEQKEIGEIRVFRNAEKALDASSSEKLVASYMKSTFEKRYKGVWHCIAGRNFGGFVTHETGKYIYFYIGQKGFLIWSTPSA